MRPAHPGKNAPDRLRARRGPGAERSRRTALRRAVLEPLEARELLATLPEAVVASQVDISGSRGDESTPSIAIDPLNPLKMAAVWTRNDPALGQTPVIAEGAVSTDGGATWKKFALPGAMTDPTSPATGPLPFAQITDAQVGFDRNENFFVLTAQHSADGKAGALLVSKFDFSGTGAVAVASPSAPSGTGGAAVVYAWSQAQAVKPALAVDANLPSFTDTDSNGITRTQVDAFSGNVYVAWATVDPTPNGATNFNPNAIRMAVSSDGGQSFSGLTTLNDGGNFGTERNTAPRIAISQGRPAGTNGPTDTGVPGGMVTVVWDDFGSAATASPPQDLIKADRVAGGQNLTARSNPGLIADAGANNAPTTTTFPINVAGVPAGFTVNDLDVEIAISHPAAGELAIELVSPNNVVVPLLLAQQGSGTGLGVGTGGVALGLTFDDQALLTFGNNGGAAAPFIGHYRAVGDLSQFNGQDPSGAWKIRITDSTTNNVGQLLEGRLIFTSNLVDRDIAGSADPTQRPTTTVASTTVRGALTGPYTRATSATAQGIGPAPTIASDNTLGQFSPHQGRLYAAYVDRYDPILVPAAQAAPNPLDNTDIFLKASDDGGVTWTAIGTKQVNDDSAKTDGFSQSIVSQTYITGRPQFQPQVAVDSSTGAVVMTYLDTRYDAARGRVATMLTASLDGGATFNPQTFANTPMAPYDAITGKTVELGPIPDNESASNPNTDALFGFGDRQALAVYGGRVYPAWASNLNGGSDGLARLDIRVAQATIAGGPRVVSSTLGRIQAGTAINLNATTNANNPILVAFNSTRAVDGTPVPDGFLITFDRPIDPSSFTIADVDVYYRDETTSGTAPGTSIPVTSVTPVHDDGQYGALSATNLAFQKRWGASRFLVKFAVPAPDKMRTGTYSYVVGPNVTDRFRAPISTDIYYPATTELNRAIPDNATLTSSLTVSTPSDVLVDANVTVTIDHPLDSDLVLTLVGPNNSSVILSNRRGGASGRNYTFTTFDDQASTKISNGTAPFTGSFQPETSLATAFGGMNPNGTWTLLVQDSAGNNVGTLVSWYLTLTTRNATPTTGATAAQRGAPMDQNADARGGEDPARGLFILSGPGDVYAAPTPKPASPAVFFAPRTPAPYGPVFDPLTLPLLVPGPSVASTGVPGSPATSDNLVTDATVDAVDVTFDRDMQAGTFGPADVLGVAGPAGPIAGPFRVTPAYNSTDVNKAIPDGGSVVSALTIPDDAGRFTIANLRVRLNITHARDADLTAVLIGPDNTQVTLFQNVGGPFGRDFRNTVLDDAASRDIASGIAPFLGEYSFSTGSALADFAGKELRGTWILRITDGSANTLTGTLNSWSLEATPQTIPAPPPFAATGLPAGIGATTSSSITVADDGGRGLVGDLNVSLDVTHSKDSALTALLIGPDGTTITLFSGVGGASGQNFTGTTLDDQATAAIGGDAAPFTGSFRPAQALSAFNGKELRGSWTLKLVDANGGTPNATLNGWSLTATPTSALARTFRIGLPTQELSGQYQVALGPDVQARNGDRVDANHNAGLDAMRGTASAGTVDIVYPFGGGQPPVGDSANTGVITDAPIVVTDSFAVQNVTLTLNIQYANDPDLVAWLIAPDGTTVPLFTHVGGAGNKQNFTNTTFDDTATTPIANAGPPFFGRFTPQQPLSAFKGHGSQGTWTLRIRSDATIAQPGKLLGWSLTLSKAVPSSGLGEPAADRTSVGFRIFTFDPTLPLSNTAWTPVGPASTDPRAGTYNGEVAGRVSAIAVDPSDSSGNTVFVAAASGGVWKTTNFLTTDPNGPTYVPLTDFTGPYAMNIGSIAVFPRNGDPNQTIVIAGTGEGDALGDSVEAPATARGIGFLRSFDGGATWQLLDSTDNRPNVAPDHRFSQLGGTSSFRIAIDPKAQPDGKLIVYAAFVGLGGNTAAGGLWRSLDGGDTWQQMRAGNAVDVLLDLNSATGAPNGNVQIVYAAFQGDGVYRSPNRGQNWALMGGGIGNPLIQNGDFPTPQPVPVTAGTTPNGAKGRIVLARPALTGDALKDKLYQGWLYAAVAGPGTVYGGQVATFDGLYLTKDFGQNWTKVRFAANGPTLPTNDTAANADYKITGNQTPAGSQFNAGNFDLALAVDPTDPNVVYLGGTSEFQSSGLVRINVTGLEDPHAHFLGNADPGVPTLQVNATGPITLNQPNRGFNPFNPNLQAVQDAPFGSTLNLIADPRNPFVNNSTVLVSNTARFTNSGNGATWTAFDQALRPDPFSTKLGDPLAVPTRGVHRIVTLTDPTTGRPRLIFGDDNGVYTAVDKGDGTLVGSVGGVTNLGTNAGNVPVINGTRNGNLQIAQLYAGAAQPSYRAALVAALPGMFYSTSRDNGYPQSDPSIVDTTAAGYGDTAGTSNRPGQPSRGSGGGIATEQNFIVDPVTGLPSVRGNVYTFKWPESLNDPAGAETQNGNATSDFFQVNNVGRTFGLLQAANGGDVADPQWPYRQGFNFAVNPLNGDQVLIGSAAGRIFRTENQGGFWLPIAEPNELDGTQVGALAFGAPDPKGPGGIGNLDNYLLAGTRGGNVYVTQTGGGGGGGGNQWTQVSGGLDGSPVIGLITDPSRGSHEAYAVTAGGAVRTRANDPTPGGQPITVPDNGTADMPLTFSDDTYIGRLSVTINVNHADVRTLKVALVGPDGTVVPLSYNVRGTDPAQNANFTNTTFDDQATGTTSGAAAPFGGTFRPTGTNNQITFLSDRYNLLTDFYGKSTKGTWKLRVTDESTDARQGTIVGWTMTTTSLGGIYHNPDTTSGAAWEGVSGPSPSPAISDTGYIFRLTSPALPGTNARADTRLRTLTSIAADWRYVIPNDFANPAAGSHPMLYASGDAGVFRSTDGGKTWLPFPSADPYDLDTTPTPPGAGGGMPTVSVRDLDLALGNIDPNSGRPRARLVVDPNDPSQDIVSPNLLLATTYGRGQYAIRLAPTVFGASLGLDAKLPATAGSDSGNVGSTIDFTDKITNVAHPYIAGYSQLSAFGNTVYVTLFDLTDPDNPVYIGGYDPNVAATFTSTTDASGRFSVPISADLPDGVRRIGVQATDQTGAKGNIATFQFTLDTTAPAKPNAPDLQPASDTGPSNTDDITSDTTPTFDVSVIENTATVELYRDGTLVNRLLDVAPVAGVLAIGDPGVGLLDGPHLYTVKQYDAAGNVGPLSAALTVLIDTGPPTAPSTPDLEPGDDTGILNSDNNTSVNANLHFDVSGVENRAKLELLRNGVVVATIADVGTPVGGAVTILDPGPLADGTYTYAVRQTDLAGNVGPLSAVLSVTVDTTAPAAPAAPDLRAADDTGLSSSDDVTATTSNLRFDVAGIETSGKNGRVDLLRDGAVVATATLTAGGVVTLTDPGPLADGTYVYTAIQYDLAGNKSLASAGLTVVIDTTSPDLPGAPDLITADDTGASAFDNVTKVNAPRFDVFPADATSRVDLLRKPAASGPGAYVVVASRTGPGRLQDAGPVSDGVYSYASRQVDLAGNISPLSAELQVTIDTVAPVATGAPDLEAASDSGVSSTDNITNVVNPTFDVAPAEPTATVQLLRNGIVIASRVGAGAIVDPGPVQPDGIYTYTAQQIDLAGNAGPVSTLLNVTIDTTPPGVPGVPDLQAASDSGASSIDNITSVTNPTFDVTPADPAAVVQLLRKPASAPASAYVVVATRTGAGALQDPGIVPDGQYDYAARQMDFAGNIGPRSASLSVRIDTTPPAAPNAPDLQPTSDTGQSNTDNITSATLLALVGGFPTFDISPIEPGATVELYRDGKLINSVRAPGSGQLLVSLADPGPQFLDGTYIYTSRQIDAAGNIGPVSAGLTVTVDNAAPAPPAAPDLQADSDTGASSTDNITSVTNPTFDIPAIEAGATLKLLRDGVVVATLTDVAGGTTSIQDPGPVNDGVHTYSALQVDVAGNTSPIGGSLRVTIDTVGPAPTPAPDLEAASDSGVSNTDNITNVVNPTFDVGPAESAATVQLLRDGVVVATRIGGGAVQDPGPVPDGLHVYTARQIDPAGNASLYSSGLIITIDTAAAAAGAPDLQPGSDSGVSNADNLTNVVNPTFDVSGVEPGSKVDLYRDGKIVATRTGAGSLQDAGPALDGLHVYTARQTDVAGNVGPFSVALNVTIDTQAPATPSAPDLQAASDSPSSGALGYVAGVTDIDNLTNVVNPTFGVTTADPSATLQLLRNGVVVATRTGAGAIADPGPLSSGSYAYTARQVDDAGNVGPASGSLTVTIDTTTPFAPGVPDLQAAADTGVSNSDDNTSVTNPTFDVAPAEVDALVQLLRDGVVVATRTGAGTIQDAGPVPDGQHVYTARQIDRSGNVGPFSAGLTITISTTTPPTPVAPTLDAKSDTGTSNTDGITSVNKPQIDFVGAGTGLTAQLYRKPKGTANDKFVLVGTFGADNKISEQVALTDGSYEYAVRQITLAGGTSSFSPPLAVTIDTVAPTLTAALGNDTGKAGDGVTSARPTVITGLTEPGALVQLLDAAGNPGASATADPVGGANPGRYSLTVPATLNGAPTTVNGRYTYKLRSVDLAGNTSSAQPTVSVALATAAGDYNGDGKADLATFQPNTARWSILDSAGGSTSLSFGTSGDVPIQADFNGDGRIDLGLFRPSTAQWFVLLSGPAGGAIVQAFGTSGDVPIPADYDGDGRADLAVFRPSTAQWFILQSTAGGRVETFGAANLDKPIPADYDGDGRADLAVFRPSTAQWFILQSSGGGRVQTFGATNLDVAVPADYDGDNKADLAVFRPTTAQWFILQSSGGGRITQVGAAGDVPVPADYDGDGLTDLATFRPTSALWSISQSTAGPRLIVQGAPGDVPVGAPYDYRKPAGSTVKIASFASGDEGTATTAGAVSTRLDLGGQAAGLASSSGTANRRRNRAHGAGRPRIRSEIRRAHAAKVESGQGTPADPQAHDATLTVALRSLNAFIKRRPHA